MKVRVNRTTIELRQGDILAVVAAGIVIEADTNLSISSELLQKAGPEVHLACREIGWCEVGSAAITPGGYLSFDRIIHAVSPRWGEGAERARLARVTLECLRLAESNRLKSLVFPPISTGVLGYPVENCARTMLTQIVNYTFEDLRHLKTIIVCVRAEQVLSVFRNELTRQIARLDKNGNNPAQIQA